VQAQAREGEHSMRTRVLSAIVALAIVVPVLAWGGPRGVWWLMFPLVLVGMDEYARMALPGLSRPPAAVSRPWRCMRPRGSVPAFRSR
jgi:CDP-diglyceride synthetase